MSLRKALAADSINRREFFQRAGVSGLATAVSVGGAPAKVAINREALLEEIQKRACLYFYEQAHPVTGLVLDRVRTDGVDNRRVASIAATGFGLSALCIAHRRGYLTKGVAQQRVERTLDFFARRAFCQKGFYFHFVDCVTGRREFECELSSIDTAWLLYGVLHARQHFDNGPIRRLANELLLRVDWQWMLAGERTLCHGWTPEKGFLPYRWDEYAELLAMYLLAMSSTKLPIPPSSWDAWTRPNRLDTNGASFIESPAPLFVHQYSHAWFDFRDKHDGWADYFQNSRIATVRHRQFCIELKDRYPWFGDDMWGITASDSRRGYVAWGGSRPKPEEAVDGTVVPCASGGSIVFLPDACARVQETMLERYGDKVWTRYGFVDAFHPEAGWYGPDVLGIDLGITLLMIENLRTGSVWNSVMASPEAKNALAAAGLVSKPTA